MLGARRRDLELCEAWAFPTPWRREKASFSSRKLLQLVGYHGLVEWARRDGDSEREGGAVSGVIICLDDRSER